LIKIEDILSLTEFHRHSREHIARLRATGRPEVLTINGRAELVVQDASAYQELIERVRQSEASLARRSQRGDLKSRR
jgi:hypothetical protein